MIFNYNDKNYTLDELYSIIPKGKTATFDINGTIISGLTPFHIGSINEDVIKLLKLLNKDGVKIYIWSRAGIDYANEIVDKLKLNKYITEVVKKGSFQPDLSFDDKIYNFGTNNIQVKHD